MVEHLAKQHQLQHMIERFLPNFENIGKPNLTPARIRSQLSSLKDIWGQFFNGHVNVVLTIPEDTRPSVGYFRDKSFDATEDIYQEALDYMTECLEELEPYVSPLHSVSHSATQLIASRIRAIEEFPPAHSSSTHTSSAAANVHAVPAFAATPISCPLCQAPHFLKSCSLFVSKNPRERRDIIKLHQRCFHCLSAKHSVQDCKSSVSCRMCNKKHHTMLHDPSESDSQSSGSSSPSSSSPPTSETSPADHFLLAAIDFETRSPTQSTTAVVTVKASNGRIVKPRALLDQGSEMTLISDRVTQLMREHRVNMPVAIYAVGGVHAGTRRLATRIVNSPREYACPDVATTALVLKSVTSSAPAKSYNLTSLNYISNLDLADPNPASADLIDLILGANVYVELSRDVNQTGAPSQPIAQHSVLGWVTSGPVDSSPRESAASTTVHAHHRDVRYIRVYSGNIRNSSKYENLLSTQRASSVASDQRANSKENLGALIYSPDTHDWDPGGRPFSRSLLIRDTAYIFRTSNRGKFATPDSRREPRLSPLDESRDKRDHDVSPTALITSECYTENLVWIKRIQTDLVSIQITR